MSDYDDRTVDELQDELRDRDLKVSGTKDELIARLEDDDASSGGDDTGDGTAQDGSDDGDGGHDRSGGGPGGDGGADEGSSGTPRLAGVVSCIRDELGSVLGLEVERVTGLSREDGGWRAMADVVEISRVPPSTDVLATYDVTTDGDGHLDGFDRVRRFRRSEGFSA